MLQSLRVRNLAIVESLEVEFGSGLNVITGETGAGKSVIIGALGLLLGMRADRSQIRSGSDLCTVEAEFQLDDPSLISPVLEELGLPPCEDGKLILRRILSATGTGKQVVNDAAATLQGLKRIGDVLVDLHGPHEHQSLLNPDFQMDLLDAFGHLDAPRQAYGFAYAAVQTLLRRREALQGDDRTIQQQIELLQYQVTEIQSAELEGLSEDALAAEHAMLANAQEILALGQVAISALSDDDSSAYSKIIEARRQLDAISRMTPEALAWVSEAEALATRARELATVLERRFQSIDVDPERLQWVEDRVTLLHRLKRKYGGSLEEILRFLSDARTRLQDLASRTERLAAIEAELKTAEADMRARGARLTAQRQKAGSELSKAVTIHLRQLGFPHGEFRVTLEAGDPRPSGLDVADFGFAPNVGEPMRPLRIIASSGEISRVMLATKAVLAEHDRVPVLVFDEVDANVGGEMGVAIGEKLAAVSRGHQVLCITHLPQVAVHGRVHFAVAKRVAKGRTFTEILPVTGKAREEEIARMLGGKDLTSVTLRHAREMLART